MLETAYLFRSIQLYHFVVLTFVFFLCDMLFTEINAAAAAIARQKARHKSERPREGDGVIGMVRRSPLPNNMG